MQADRMGHYADITVETERALRGPQPAFGVVSAPFYPSPSTPTTVGVGGHGQMCSSKWADPGRYSISPDPLHCGRYGLRCPRGWESIADECGCACVKDERPPPPLVPSIPPFARPRPVPPAFSVPRTGITRCPPGGTGPICADDYRPVCGCRIVSVNKNQASLECRTHSNSCRSCQSADFWTEGVCP